MDAAEARRELYEVMSRDRSFDWKAEQALALGERYLGVENGHLTEIHPDSNYWRSIAGTDGIDGEFPTGRVFELGETYCRRVVAAGESVALHDAPAQGWVDDPAFETHGLHCYHGTPITVEGELYGTVCFVSTDPRDVPFSDEETMFAELIARMLEHELEHERVTNRLDRLEQFADVLAHDLRNPLAVAQGHLDLARETVENDHLETSARALDRIETIISNLLTIARQGRSVENVTRVDLSRLAERCWASVATADATLTIADDIRIRAAPDRLTHLFENLFRNAVEHGGETVTIRVGALPEAAGFYVEDDGPGIPEADRERVFDHGYTTGTEGIGLGLAIVDAVVAAHEWTITATESPEGGARFEIRDVAVLEAADD